MQLFDPNTIPLSGQRLIEASAGTGKTFSIALIFLRLLLERKLDVDQILVVTFTRSATEELRERIRSRLREALDLLEQADANDICCEDRLLQDLLRGISARAEAMLRLTDAMARMDEAAIFTIHGFCQRMLQEHAFESGAPFAVELVDSEQELRREIIRDFWRRTFYGASAEETLWAEKNWKNPGELAKRLDPLVARTGIRFLPDVFDKEISSLRQEVDACWQKILACWEKEEGTIRTVLETDKCLRRRKGEYKQGEGLEDIFAWLDMAASHGSVPWHLPRQGELLAASIMATKLKGKGVLPQHELFSLVDAYRDKLRMARILVVESAWRFLGSELAMRKQKRAQMHYHDLLTRMARALKGNGGSKLVRRIRERFAVALVDEFQDTDTLQYAIFRRLFGQKRGSALFMIGDPKQAIYSFRGADVFAYIKAKRETAAEDCYTMDRNYRSTSAMVQAVNRLFNQKGSFVFDQDIPFRPVSFAGRADDTPLLIEGAVPRPLQAMMLEVAIHATQGESSIAKENASEGASCMTAHEISRLLRLGADGKAQIGEKALAGGDIAVLVRSHREAEKVQRELSRLRIASVYYSQDSVFSSGEAWELQQLLLALLDPSDTGQVKSALATGLFGRDAHDLEQLHGDTTGWDDVVAMFGEYQHCWRSQGVAAMLHRVLAEQQVVQRMIGLIGGERKLTNYLHLAELLQEASEWAAGGDSLVRWLIVQRQDPEKTGEKQQLRLESDENLVRIVTIHKAKGLEYPVVFLPFAWNARVVDKKEIFFFHLPRTSDQVADMGTGEEENYALAERERIAEDLRLLYVALTRARYCCYFTWGRIRSMEKTALARLLHGSTTGGEVQFNDLTEEQIQEDLERLREEGMLENASVQINAPFSPPSAVMPGTASLAPAIFRGTIDTAWCISSYSRMVRASTFVTSTGEVETGQPGPPEAGSGRTVFTFPKGPAAGTCLHSILERLDFSSFSSDELKGVVKEQLQKNGIDLEWGPLVCRWMTDVLACPLPPHGDLRLHALGKDERLVEMEFYFAMTPLDISTMNRVLTKYSFSPVEMQEEELRGLMRGFIDLVFASGGKYFLADYKSNYLGPEAANYLPASLEHAMREHRYDLQSLIYTVALHRYLRTRVRGYDYGVHFGGLYYLFLRGMHPDNTCGTGVYYRLPEREMVDQLDRCFGILESA